MSKSYRLRTKPGTDRQLRIKIEQDFDFLEVLSLKLRQEDVYSRFCADYGVVVGRVIANGGYGIPNANVSVFVPIDSVDENNPIISTLYPFKKPQDKNEDGYRYNLLPYEKEYDGHTPTGTFPSRRDVLTRKEVLEVYEKYYKYTVKTNESGDFMIVGVPLGEQKLVLDLDLSNMGQFSLRPADLVRMGMAVKTQFDGQNFKSSEDLNSLPQIVNSVIDINVSSFWGEEDLCDVGITRADFDLRDMGIEIEPQAIFMGSIFSTTEDDYIKGNCKPKNDVGKLCDTTTGPGQILSIRQTINIDENGDPVLEKYNFVDGGNVIDENGVWMIDVPMNLDYVITNEFGEQIISRDPSVGIPTRAKYRFKIKWQNERGLQNDFLRAHFLVPNIRENGWTGTLTENMPNEIDRNKSYAFSLSWEDYYDKEAAINCEDTFYHFHYNKVYTIASNIDRFKWGRGRQKHLGLKEIEDKKCQSEINKFPINDAQRNGKILIMLFNFIITLFTPIALMIIAILHVLALLYTIVRILLNIIISILNGIIYIICLIVAVFSRRLTFADCKKKKINKLPKENPFKNISLPMITYPDCEMCACNPDDGVDNSSDVIDSLEQLDAELNMGPLVDATWFDVYDASYCGGDGAYITGGLICSGYDNNEKDRVYLKLFKEVVSSLDSAGNEDDEREWYKSPAYPLVSSQDELRWRFSMFPTWAHALNIMNSRDMYFGNCRIVANRYFTNILYLLYNSNTYAGARRVTNAINVTLKNNQLGFNAQTSSWTDMCNVILMDPGTTLEDGAVFTFNDPTTVNDPNVNKYPQGNEFGDTSLTGTTGSYSTENYVSRQLKFMNRWGSEQTVNIQVYNPEQKSSYKFKSGVEYFQVIKAMTISEMTSYMNWNEDVYLLRNFVWEYYSTFNCNDDSESYDDGSLIARKKLENEGLDIVVVFCVRGIDLYTPKQRIKYDLSKLFGFGNNTDAEWANQVVFEGDYYLNIPIQSNGNHPSFSQDEHTPIAHYRWKDNRLEFYNGNNYGYSNGDNFNTNLFHKSYTFEPNSNEWSSFNTYSFNKYVSLDKQINADNQFDDWMGDDGGGVSCPNEGWPSKGISPYVQNRVEGVGFQFSKANSSKRKLDQENDIISVSPLYLPRDYQQGMTESEFPDGTPYTTMGNSQKIIFRSDRLPASNVYDEGDFNRPEFRRYALHMNLRQQLFIVDETGAVSTIDGDPVTPSDASGAYDDDIEDTNNPLANVMASFQCEGMVPLKCYQGEGEEFTVIPSDECDLPGAIDADERLINGCYRFVIRRLIISIVSDWLMFFEYRTRLRLMFAVCQGVIGQTFQNNWVNGTLYMPTFQKKTFYNSDNQVSRYKYCGDPLQPFLKVRYQGPLYFNTQTNNFYYRSTPFNNETMQFVGQEPTRQYPGANYLNIWSPTTIMELGPRDEFTKQISFTPEFEGYVVDKLQTSSYKDSSGIINLFIIARLTNANFLENLLGLGDASISGLFSRGGFFEARVDGDYAQLISINSEFGVVPYIDGNYEDSITVYDDRIGIWFESDTISRRLLTDGTVTFSNDPDGPDYNYGFQGTQYVPYFMWKINDNNLFGTELNNWDTSTVYSSKYQGDDFFNSNPQTYMKPNTGYGMGYIFNRNNSDPELDQFPSNTANGNNFKVGSPFHFYFGLKRGKSAINKYIKNYIFLVD